MSPLVLRVPSGVPFACLPHISIKKKIKKNWSFVAHGSISYEKKTKKTRMSISSSNEHLVEEASIIEKKIFLATNLVIIIILLVSMIHDLLNPIKYFPTQLEGKLFQPQIKKNILAENIRKMIITCAL